MKGGRDQQPLPNSSLNLLNKYRPSFSRFTVEKLDKLVTGENDQQQGRALSTQDIMRVASAWLVQSETEGKDAYDQFMDPYISSGLTADEIKKTDLAILLLQAATNLSKNQHDQASLLLAQCRRLSSSIGSPVERVVYYFSEALQERIVNQIRRQGSLSKKPTDFGAYFMKVMQNNQPTQLAMQDRLPFAQLVQFILVQTILDHMASAKRIHIIDISIKHGLQWATLMQALATRTACPVQQLKISAVGGSEAAVATTGKMLSNFADTLGLPFIFKPVIVADMRELKKESFQVEEGETLGVYSSMDINNMIARQDALENLMIVVCKLRPCIITIADAEAKLNSLSFAVRFTEALFHFSAMFDFLDEFMDGDDITRMAIERDLLAEGIINIIATEGSERLVRHVGISVWRSFFGRFGLSEVELNEWTLYQASLILKRYKAEDSCTVHQNEKSLIIGWKGTPLLFASAWKFL